MEGYNKSLNCKLALSSCNKIIDEELFRNYSENNIEVMEISASLEECESMDFLQLQKETPKKIGEAKKNLGMWGFVE